MSSSLPLGEVGFVYSATLTASGGTTPYSWTVVQGNLPTGLQLALDGTLSGTPQQDGSWRLGVEVSDSGTPPNSAQATFLLLVDPQSAPLAIAAQPLPPGQVGAVYSASLSASASGGTPPHRWETDPATLPPGIVLSPAGDLSGSPTREGVFNWTATLLDDRNRSAQESFSIQVGGFDTWRRTGNDMSEPRALHTATLLPDGRVLLAGGYVGPLTPVSFLDPTDSVEIYDPLTDLFTTMPSMSLARGAHSALLLPNGQVLFHGGETDGQLVVGDPELYDPATGSTQLLSLGGAPLARYFGEAVITNDANGFRITFVGGMGDFPSGDPVVEVDGLISDPSGNLSWSGPYSLDPNYYGDIFHDVVSLPAGHPGNPGPEDRFVVVGMDTGPGPGFTPGSLRCLYASPTGIDNYDLDSTRMGLIDHTATLLDDGTILIAGGTDFGVMNTEGVLYDPQNPSQLFTSTRTSPNGTRGGHRAVKLGSGEVLLMGGIEDYNQTSFGTSTAERYRPSSGTWVSASDMFFLRLYPTATLLPTGEVLVTGGFEDMNTFTVNGSAEIYLP